MENGDTALKPLLADLLLDETLDFESYDLFLENWQELASRHSNADEDKTRTREKIRELEALSKTALAKLVSPDGDAGYGANPIFNALQNSALICDQGGLIRQVNAQAESEFGLAEGMRLDATGITDTESVPLGTVVSAYGRTTDISDLNIIQCRQDDDTPLNLTVLALPPSEGTLNFLIVFMNTPWGADAQNLLMAKFGLSEAEADIVGAFAKGIGLKQIAEQRDRAYATIRNQFQSALEKTGCPNQADILRLMLGTSFLFSQIQALSADTTPKLGKKVEMVRPGGRFLDVRLFGDLRGEPFICFPSIFGLPITPAIEQILKNRKLLMLGVARPGYGGTSPAPADQLLSECLAADVVALLDSMEIDKCVFTGRASAGRSMFNLAALIPERISRAYVVNSLIPRPYVKRSNTLSKWTVSLMSASKVSSSMTTLILGTGKKLMFRNGVSRFVGKMYQASESDKLAANDPDVADSIREGVDYVIQQGFDAGVRCMIEGFEDWSTEAAAAKTPVTLLQGADDPNVPLSGAKMFADDYPEIIKLIEFEDGGGLLNYTHTEQLLNAMQLRPA